MVAPIRWFLIAAMIVAPAAAADSKSKLAELSDQAGALVGKTAPDFVLPDLGGKQVRLSDSRGRVVLLAFWATWCPPCRTELPYLAKIQRELSSRGVDVVLVAYDKPAKVRALLLERKIEASSLLDEFGSAARQYGAEALPKTFILRRDGTVAQYMRKKQSEKTLRQALENVLSGR